MSVQLLDKTRKINRLLHNNSSSKLAFNDICKVLSEILESNIFVISRKGKILGKYNREEIETLYELMGNDKSLYIDKMLNERFLNILSTKENINLVTLGFGEEAVPKYKAMVTPVDIAGVRLGTLFVYKSDKEYGIDDIILSEYGATVVGLEMSRSVNEESNEEERKKQVVKAAIGTLSYTESEAVKFVLKEMKGTEDVIVASHIADIAGITRSVIVNALRKLESAGVVESKSSGMKGTYIKVINEYVYDEVFNRIY